MNIVSPASLTNARLRRPMAPSLERRRLQLYLLLLVGDTAMLFAGFLCAGWFYLGSFLEPTSFLAAKMLLPIFLTVGIYNATYSVWSLTSFRFGCLRLLSAIAISVSLLLFVMFLGKMTAEFSRVTFFSGLLLSVLAMIAVRRLITRAVLAAWGPNPQNVLIIHDGGPDLHLPHAYHVNAADHAMEPVADDPNALHHIGTYLRNMDRVIVSCPIERRAAWSSIMRAAGVRGELSSDILHEIGAVALQKERHFTTLMISVGPLGLRSRLMKRCMDIGFSLCGILLAAPIMLPVAVAIRLEDGGPVLFRQRRLGRGNCFFEMYKFRSMSVALQDCDGNQSTSRQDQRITRIGRFIRRTSIDEIPQLFNVLRGDMSLVGPRPHALGSHVDDRLFWEIESRYWDRHSLKPGVTGLAQVMGLRGATDVDHDLIERVRYDLEYIQNWSPWLDLWIILRTFKVLVHENAY